MPEIARIKWRQSDADKLKKLIKSYNAKLTRLAKRNPENVQYYPPKVTYTRLRQSIQTRKELNENIRVMRNFTKKGMEQLVTNPHGVTVTKWELHETRVRVQRINRSRAAEAARAQISPEAGNMGTIKSNSLLPKKFDFGRISSPKEWEMFLRTVNHQSQPGYYDKMHEIYRQNLLKAANERFGEGNMITQLLEMFTTDQLVDMYYQDTTIIPEYVYSKEDAETVFQNVFEHLTRYAIEFGIASDNT